VPCVLLLNFKSTILTRLSTQIAFLSPLFATVYLKPASGGIGALIATFTSISYSIQYTYVIQTSKYIAVRNSGARPRGC